MQCVADFLNIYLKLLGEYSSLLTGMLCVGYYDYGLTYFEGLVRMISPLPRMSVHSIFPQRISSGVSSPLGHD